MSTFFWLKNHNSLNAKRNQRMNAKRNQRKKQSVWHSLVLQFKQCFFLASNLLKGFEIPQFLQKISLSHMYDKYLPSHLRPGKVNNYMLLSVKDAVTNWHSDFSNTSVMYAIVSGKKEFCVIPWTMQNSIVFHSYKKSGQRLFFESIR